MSGKHAQHMCTSHTNTQSAQDILWASGIKATAPRMAIVAILIAEMKPVSIEQISVQLPAYSTASIYRTLKLLTEYELASEIHTGSAHSSYELAHGRKHHHHLICVDCGDMEDVERCVPPHMESAIIAGSRKFSSLSRHSLEFFGTCKKCDRSSV